MKLVILAGGLGSRLSEETQVKPKPLVEIGGMPIIWHIMKIYSEFGIKDFVICLGYKGHLIKEFFHNYHLYSSNVTVEVGKGVKFHNESYDDWSITMVDTGHSTQTGGRLKRVQDYLGDEDFCLTYGDGLGDVNIGELLSFHKAHRRIATVTATHPTARFGALGLNGTKVEEFIEKPISEAGWINGGFFVMRPQIFDYIDGDHTLLEQEPMRNLARDGELHAFFHHGFWQPMDTLREKNILEDLWTSGEAPWKNWN
jgi:glucose-1-phosphate cytidylyltransferase